MTNEEAKELFDAFTRDHPEYASHGRWADTPGGREFVFTTEAMEAFARWSLINSLGDGNRTLGFLTEGLPNLKAHAAALRTGGAVAYGAGDDELACWRVADLAAPKAGSVRGHRCQRCAAEVWVMPGNLSLGLRVVCRQCGLKRAETDGLALLPASAARGRPGPRPPS